MEAASVKAAMGREITEETLRKRVRELRSELNLGEGELQELQRRQSQLRDTLLRISGAIQVLDELLRTPVK